MRMLKLLVTLGITLVMFSCSTQPEVDPNKRGRIGFAVNDSDLDRVGRLEVEIHLKHQESGKIHKKTFKSGLGHRVNYFQYLAPGRYLIEKCHGTWNGDCLPSLEENSGIEVKPGQTSLSPFYVVLHDAPYPGDGLPLIRDEDFWLDYGLKD